MKTRHPHKKAKGTTKLLAKPFHYNISASFLKKMLSKPCKARKKKTVKPDHVCQDDSVKDRSGKELAEHALLFYNEAARLTRSQEYQFVKDKSYNCYRVDGASTTVWYHLNFVARCTLGTQESTFFAEIRENDSRLLVVMCQIVALTSEEIPCLAGCKICDKDDCRDTLIHPVTGITKEFETETSSLQEDQPHISSFIWTKPLPTSSMKLKPVHYSKPAPSSCTRDVKSWKAEKLALVALNFYNEAARLSKGPQYQYVKVTSYCYLFIGCSATTWHHLNFVARPTSEAREFTFFAEISELEAMLSIMRCQIVDDTRSLGGCDICDNYGGRDIIHPTTGVYEGY